MSTPDAFYDDRDGQLWLDGALVPWREAKIHVLTHGLHYASAVFEGERVYDNRIFALREHTERLFRSAEMLGFAIPWTLEQVEEASRQAVAAQGMRDGYVRPIAWRGAEMMGVSAQQTTIHLAIAAWEWGAYFDAEQAMRGIRLDLAHWRRPDPATIPALAKATGLYMICTLAKHTAENRGYADALMLDWRGRVAEATGANIFFVRDGKLHTPTPDCFLDGITRRAVIGLAKARGIETIERAIQPEEMKDFDECFLTGTAAEVTPVSEIAEVSFQPGAITRMLVDDYAKLVRAKPSA